MTEALFANEPTLKSCAAIVIAARDGAVILDKTVFFAAGGGQPGDTGTIGGARIVDARKGDDGAILHILEDGAAAPAMGASVDATIDWDRRWAHMRMHSALHLLCASVEGDVTGGQIGAEKSRLDFNIPGDAVDKATLTEKLNALVAQDAAITTRWVDEAELDANPQLVRTAAAAPPRTGGQVRLVEIAGIDLQPCGGTHVARTGEIGAIHVAKIENKGKKNRRITIMFGPAP